jgi:F0F1-type ATP synthase alpha subunit
MTSLNQGNSNRVEKEYNFFDFASPDNNETYGTLISYRDGIGLVSGISSIMYGESVVVESEGRHGDERPHTLAALAYNLRLDGLRSVVKASETKIVGVGVPSIPRDFCDFWLTIGSQGAQPNFNQLDFHKSSLGIFEKWLKMYLSSLSKRCVFQVGIIFITGDLLELQPGSKIFPSGRLLRFPTGIEFLGRTIGVLGEVTDGDKVLCPKVSEYRLVEAEAPSIISRKGVCEPLRTGVLALDSIVPIGKGQRQLIIGDRQTGKTSLALEAVINQTRLKHLYLMSSLLRLKQMQFISSIIESMDLKSSVDISCIYSQYNILADFLFQSKKRGSHTQTTSVKEAVFVIPEPSFSILLNLPVSRLSLEKFLLKNLDCRLQHTNQEENTQEGPTSTTAVVSFLKFVLNGAKDEGNRSTRVGNQLESATESAANGSSNVEGADEEGLKSNESSLGSSVIFGASPALIYSNAIRRWDCLFDADDVGLLQFYLPTLPDLTTLILGYNFMGYSALSGEGSLSTGNCSSPNTIPISFDFSSLDCFTVEESPLEGPAGESSSILGTLGSESEYPKLDVDDEVLHTNMSQRQYAFSNSSNSGSTHNKDQHLYLSVLSPLSSRVVSRSGVAHGEIPDVVIGLTPTLKDTLVVLFSTIALANPGYSPLGNLNREVSDTLQALTGQEDILYPLSSFCPALWSSDSVSSGSLRYQATSGNGVHGKAYLHQFPWVSPWDSVSFLEKSLRSYVNYTEGKEKGSFCVYVSVGQKSSFVASLIRSLRSAKLPDLFVGDLGIFMSGSGLDLTLKYHPSTYPSNFTPRIEQMRTKELKGLLNEHSYSIRRFAGSSNLEPSTVADTQEISNSIPSACAYDYTVIVSALSDSTAAAQYLAPYSGMAYSEYLVGQGSDVLVVFDDLTKQAVAYRQISLSFYRPPGREAFPGDIFFVHARLLERVARTKVASVTSFPLLETQSGDVSSFIPTNVISITDGQIILKKELHSAGQIPGLDVGLSVSRVGSTAQSALMKNYASSLKLVLAQYNEVLSFSKFQEDVSDDVRKSLDAGMVLLELLKHDRFGSVCEFYQVILLILATSSRSFLVSPPENFPLSKQEALSGEFLSGLRRHSLRYIVGKSFFSANNNGSEKVFIENEPLRKFLVAQVESALGYKKDFSVIPPESSKGRREDFRRFADLLAISRFIGGHAPEGQRCESTKVMGSVSRGTDSLESFLTLPISINYDIGKSSLPYYFRPYELDDIFSICDAGHFSVAYQSSKILTKLIAKRFYSIANYKRVDHPMGAKFNCEKREEIENLLSDLIDPSPIPVPGEDLSMEELHENYSAKNTVLTYPAPRKFFTSRESTSAFRFLENFANLFLLDYAIKCSPTS